MAAQEQKTGNGEGSSSSKLAGSPQPDFHPPPSPWHPERADFVTLFRGLCMGAADAVPGVSGGTVALVLGHYERLIRAISRVDRQAIELLLKRRFREFVAYLDLRFLIVLLLGILLGIASLASFMNWALENRYPQTMAVFFGLVLASGYVVGRRVEAWSPASAVAFALAIWLALGIGRLQPLQGNPTLLYLFISGAIAICAMILPGISGAFVLLLLGAYHSATGLVSQFIHGEISVDVIVRLTVFTLGCLCGLLCFSRLIKWLLQHYHSVTLAALTGLMLGSLERLWPLQRPQPATQDLEFERRIFDYYGPHQWPLASLLVLASLIVIAAVVVIIADFLGRRLES